jgi:hypothetical protein
MVEFSLVTMTTSTRRVDEQRHGIAESARTRIYAKLPMPADLPKPAADSS